MSILVDDSLRDALFSLEWFQEDYVFPSEDFSMLEREDIDKARAKIASDQLEDLLVEMALSFRPKDYSDNLNRVFPFALSAHIIFTKWMESPLISQKVLIAIIEQYGLSGDESLSSTTLTKAALRHKNLSISYIDYLVGEALPDSFYADLFARPDISAFALNTITEQARAKDWTLWRAIFFPSSISNPNISEKYLWIPFQELCDKSFKDKDVHLLERALLNPNVNQEMVAILEDTFDAWKDLSPSLSLHTKILKLSGISDELFLKILRPFVKNFDDYFSEHKPYIEPKLDSILERFGFEANTLSLMPLEMKLQFAF